MASSYKVIYTLEAIKDLGEVFAYISGIAWRRSAEKWVLKILDKTESLATFPEGNPVYEYDNRYRSAKVGKYKIIYRVDKRANIVSILRIVYARRNLRRII